MSYVIHYIGIIVCLIICVGGLNKTMLSSPDTKQTSTYNNDMAMANQNSLESWLLRFYPKSHSAVMHSNSKTQSSSVEEPMSNLQSPGLGDSKVNVKHFTQFVYEGAQVYVYDAKTNEEYTDPKMWSFYYVPILQPVKAGANSDWAWVYKNEVRVRIALGTEEVEKRAREAISKRYDDETVFNYSQFWIVAPLMIDTLNSYIVTGSSTPVEAVAPSNLVNPNKLIITMRFICTTGNIAKTVVQKVLDGDYEIEVAFMFAGWWGIKENSISVTGNQLKAVLSKTTADGGGTNNTYIHRNQASKFIGRYVTNVRTLIYMENPNTNLSESTADLPARFAALFQQGMESAQNDTINAKAYDQVWDPSDLNPDRIIRELNKMFTYNETETQSHDYEDKYFNYNSDWKLSSSMSTSASATACIYGKFGCVGVSMSLDVDFSQEHQQSETKHEVYSSSDIKHELQQQSMEIEWEGEKFVPKAFYVYKLADVADRLQVAIVNKQLFAEKSNGAIIRKVNLEDFITSTASKTLLTGEIRLYAVDGTPPLPWLLCDGAAVSRIIHQRLFSVIGTSYGPGDGLTTFNLPDFRDRFPLGLNPDSSQIDRWKKGGNKEQTLTIDQMPTHNHSAGTLYTTDAGMHTHTVNDSGHNHGGHTGEYLPTTSTLNRPGPGYTVAYGTNVLYGFDGPHRHDIPVGKTGITLDNDGTHSHSIGGSTSSVGHANSFSIMPPYQTIAYIIYSGADCA